jgi:N-acetylneuraminic acid mutarotase
MKKIYSLTIAILISCQLFAQAPNKMSYQAVIRNSSNNLVASKGIGMQVSILQGSATGTAVYVERHFPNTNANGLASIEIGTGTLVSGSFSTINWANGPYFIKTETDINGGATYTITGTSELMSVPYALFAANSAPGPQGLQGPQGIQGIKGDTGVRGLQGIQGIQGIQGVKGDSGARGLQGIQGIKGDSGLRGIQGIQGIQGIKGDSGARGLQGIQGIQGVKGDTGARGLNGDTAWAMAGTVIYNKNSGNVGIGTTTPQSKLSVGTSSQFQVDSIGNLRKINNVPTSFPATQGSNGQVLTNNGSGNLSWSAVSNLQKSGSVVLLDTYDTSMLSAGYTFLTKIQTTGQKKLADSASWQWGDEFPIVGAPAISANQPRTIWTGSEVIVLDNYGSNLTGGGKYNPITNSWTSISTIGAPTNRNDYTAVWTGTEVIIWGGDSNYNRTNSGYRYNPTTNAWAAISNIGAPTPRGSHTAVWTGTEMIIWGGDSSNYYNSPTNTGGRYNPITNSWATLPILNAPSARMIHSAIWTGTEMIIWRGDSVFDYSYYSINNGGRYNPSTNSWSALSTLNAPVLRKRYSIVWTGTEMIIWGGDSGNYYNSATKSGGRYNPSTNTWTTTSNFGTPSKRSGHVALWTGNRMIVWGGSNGQNDGGIYNPLTNTWASTSLINAPADSYGLPAFWTGTEMIFMNYTLNNTKRFSRFAPTLGGYENIYMYLFRKN